MADNALYGLPQQYRGQNALMSGQQEPVMRSYQEPWYRALPNRLTDYIYGPDATAQQAAGVRHLVGPENPLNLPAQFSEGVDTARTGYQLGNNLMTGLGALQAGTSLPIPGIFAGPAARTANHAALAQAQKMATSGAPREAIHAQTGWFKGVDGKWRFEIDDSASALRNFKSADGTLGDVLSHESLASAYPDVASINTSYKRNQGLGSGSYGDEYKNMRGETVPEKISIEAPNKNSGNWSGRSIGLHEAQHAIQHREGFASGASPLDFTSFGRYRDVAEQTPGIDHYKHTAGEVEARAVQKRMDMTPEERAARPPWLDYDVPEADQIVRMGGTGPQMSLPEQPKGIKAKAARPEPDGLNPQGRSNEASPVLAETPEYKRAEAAAVKGFERDLRDNETIYFDRHVDYDHNGDRLPLDEHYPSLYRSDWASILPATARAVEDAAGALGHKLSLVNANSGSRYGTFEIGGKKYKVRVADHERQSAFHENADFNIAPGGITPFDFIEELIKLKQPKGISAERGSPHVFDPATIEILRKYGLLGLMSGSVAAGAMPQQPNALYGGQ